MSQYTKKYLSVGEQLALLNARGMVTPDEELAKTYLQQIGYYRLSAYWHPFRKTQHFQDGQGRRQTIWEDMFKHDTQFPTIVDLYVFDKRLRLLILDALERIEISLRSQIALTLGKHNPWAHRDTRYLNTQFATSHKEWLERCDREASRSKTDFANHFREKYPSSQFPIWIAVEMMDFGSLSILLNGLTPADKKTIALSYKITRPGIFISWVRTLSYMRNVCAHHARLWNIPLVIQPKLPPPKEFPEFTHWLSQGNSQTRLYGSLSIMQFLLKTVSPSTKWHERIKAHISTFPLTSNMLTSGAGFPQGWDKEELWK